MRPKRLEIEGLQSFREAQTIDFDTLGATGLFGIFGPTGSGKSTILDAITFALYGKVKRAERGTQGVIHANLNRARVAFTFSIGPAEKRKTFRVERTYQRKKGHDSACEPKVVRLLEITAAGDIPVADRASEVSHRIESLLGLNHEDFTRAVVLPQNSFQEFLLLDNAKKREMLERIFYLEEYGQQLWEKLNRKMSRLRRRIDRLAGEQAAYQGATAEDLERARTALTRAEQEKTRVEKELELLEPKYLEAREVWQLVQELEQVEEKEQRHLAVRDMISNKKQRLEKAAAAAGLLPQIQERQEAEAKLREAETQLREVTEQLAGVLADLEGTRQQYQELRRKTAAEQPRLVEWKTRLQEALTVQAEIDAGRKQLDELEKTAARLQAGSEAKKAKIDLAKQALTGLEEEIKKQRQELESLRVAPEYREQMLAGVRQEQEVETLELKVRALETDIDTLDSQIARLEQELEQNGAEVKKLNTARDTILEALAAEPAGDDAVGTLTRDAVLQRREELHGLEMLSRVLEEKEAALEGLKAKMIKQAEEKKRLGETRDRLEKEKREAARRREQARLALEKAMAAVERDAACRLSRKLKAGEPCPVCGSVSHPQPAVPDTGATLEELEQQRLDAEQQAEAAEQALKDRENACLAAGEQDRILTGQIEQNQNELEEKTAEYREIKQQLPPELQALNLTQLAAALAHRAEVIEKQLEAIANREKRMAELQTEKQKIEAALVQAQLAEQERQTELKVNRENREQKQALYREANRSFMEKKRQYLEFLERYRINSATAELERLADRDRRFSAGQKKLDEKVDDSGRKSEYLKQLQEELRKLESERIRAEADSSSMRCRIEEKETRLRQLAGDHDPAATIKEIEAKMEAGQRQEEACREKLTALENRYQELTTRKTLLDQEQTFHTGRIQALTAKLEQLFAATGFADSESVLQSIIPDEELEALQGEINAFEQEAQNIRAEKQVLRKKIGKRWITEAEWDRTRTAYQELLAKKEDCVAGCELARNNFRQLQEKHEKWKLLTENCGELEQKYGLWEQIQKLLRAERGKDNSFIDYIAEERLRYVAAKATEILGEMTKYKYALELDPDTGFLIRDYTNGGVHRMASSLSGGETFVTSLALALALSEQIQLKGQSPLEFFFLDEGFGTLDQQMLDTVMDALERLSSRDRVIGLISHVPELRSRMARRLIVEPPSLQGEGSRVRLEKA